LIGGFAQIGSDRVLRHSRSYGFESFLRSSLLLCLHLYQGGNTLIGDNPCPPQ